METSADAGSYRRLDPNPNPEPNPRSAAAMQSDATPPGPTGRVEAAERAEVNGQPDGIPEATVARLPVYLRALYGLAERGISTVASEELAAAAGVNSAKLRKDLSHLGS